MVTGSGLLHMTEKALFDPNEAAEYLGVSRSFFDDEIRPHIAVVDMKSPRRKQPMWRFDKADLDKFIASRKRGAAA